MLSCASNRPGHSCWMPGSDAGNLYNSLTCGRQLELFSHYSSSNVWEFWFHSCGTKQDSPCIRLFRHSLFRKPLDPLVWSQDSKPDASLYTLNWKQSSLRLSWKISIPCTTESHGFCLGLCTFLSPRWVLRGSLVTPQRVTTPSVPRPLVMAMVSIISLVEKTWSMDTFCSNRLYAKSTLAAMSPPLICTQKMMLRSDQWL